MNRTQWRDRHECWEGGWVLTASTYLLWFGCLSLGSGSEDGQVWSILFVRSTLLVYSPNATNAHLASLSLDIYVLAIQDLLERGFHLREFLFQAGIYISYYNLLKITSLCNCLTTIIFSRRVCLFLMLSCIGNWGFCFLS